MTRLWNGDDVTVAIPTIEGRYELLERAVRSVGAGKIHPRTIEVEMDYDRTGAAATRNRIIDRVETEWIAFLDDDDEFLANHLKAMLVGANLSGADLIYTYAEFPDCRDPLATVQNINGQVQFVEHPISVPWGPESEWWLRNKGNWIPVTNMVRTSALRAVGGFPEPYSMPEVHNGSQDCEDALLLIKLLDAGYTFHHAALGQTTWIYHVWGGNLGGRGAGRMHEMETVTQSSRGGRPGHQDQGKPHAHR